MENPTEMISEMVGMVSARLILGFLIKFIVIYLFIDEKTSKLNFFASQNFFFENN
jgi:hypothetical protein